LAPEVPPVNHRPAKAVMMISLPEGKPVMLAAEVLVPFIQLVVRIETLFKYLAASAAWKKRQATNNKTKNQSRFIDLMALIMGAQCIER